MTLVDSVRAVLVSCQSTMANMAALIPENQYWRWKDMWTNSLRSAVYSAVFCEFLANGTLLSLESTCDQLGSMANLWPLAPINIDQVLYYSQKRMEGPLPAQRRGLSAWRDHAGQ